MPTSAPLPWLKIATDLFDHPKTKALVHRLRFKYATHYVTALFMYGAKKAQDGIVDPKLLEDVLQWDGEPGALVRGFIDVGFLDVLEDGRCAIHAWEEHNGAHVRTVHKRRESASRRRQIERQASLFYSGANAEKEDDAPRDGGPRSKIEDLEDSKDRSTRSSEAPPDEPTPPAPSSEPPASAKQSAPKANGKVPQEVLDVWQHFRATLGDELTPADIPRGMIALVKLRLKEYGGKSSVLLEAITGAKLDPWHNGEKDGVKKLGITQVLANADRIASLARRARGAKPATKPLVSRYVLDHERKRYRTRAFPPRGCEFIPAKNDGPPVGYVHEGVAE